MAAGADFCKVLTSETRLVYHVTRAASLPDIIASGALLPAAARRNDVQHSWGANESEGRELVCLSLRPSWAILNNQFLDEEAAILGFSPKAIAELDEIRPCPGNSGSRDLKRYVTGSVGRDRALAECLVGDTPVVAELLIAGNVPLDGLQLVVLSDAEAANRWTDALSRWLSERVPGIKARIRASDPHKRPRFPENHRVTAARAEVRPGIDQALQPVSPPRRLDLPELDEAALDVELAELDELLEERSTRIRELLDERASDLEDAIEADDDLLYDDAFGPGRAADTRLDFPYSEGF